MTRLELSCDVLLVTPFTLRMRWVAGTWSCSRCGEPHPARTSFSVLLRRRSDGERVSSVVCPECATTLQPLALALAHHEGAATA